MPSSQVSSEVDIQSSKACRIPRTILGKSQPYDSSRIAWPVGEAAPWSTLTLDLVFDLRAAQGEGATVSFVSEHLTVCGAPGTRRSILLVAASFPDPELCALSQSDR